MFFNPLQVTLAFKRYFCQTLAVPKSSFSKLLDASRNEYVFEIASKKAEPSDLLELAALREGRTLQLSAVAERVCSDLPHADWYRHALDAGVPEPVVSDLLGTTRNNYLLEVSEVPDINTSNEGLRWRADHRGVWNSGERKGRLAAVLDMHCFEAFADIEDLPFRFP